MRKGIQNMMEAAGKWGCCALCLIDLAERQTRKAIDPAIALDYAIGKGWIEYHWDNPNHKDNYFVARLADFFNFLTGRKWKYHHENVDYPLKKSELEIQVYKRATLSEQERLTASLRIQWTLIAERLQTSDESYAWAMEDLTTIEAELTRERATTQRLNRSAQFWRTVAIVAGVLALGAGVVAVI